MGASPCARLRQRLAFDDVTVAKDEAKDPAKRSDVKQWKFQGNELHPRMVDLLGSQLLHCGQTAKKKGEKKLGSPGLQATLGMPREEERLEPQLVSIVHLAKADVVGLFFGADWCPSSQPFSTLLGRLYHATKNSKEPHKSSFEVVFISHDKDEFGYREHTRHMPWLALPWRDRDRKDVLASMFKVRTLPKLVLLQRDGTVLTTEGMTRVQRDEVGRKFPWPDDTYKAAVSDIFAKSKYVDPDKEIKKPAGGVYEYEEIKDKIFFFYFASRAASDPLQLQETVRRYQALKASPRVEARGQFEMIYVPLDETEEDFKAHHLLMPWLTIPFSHRLRRFLLVDRFEIDEGSKPRLVVVDTNGKTLNGDALLAFLGPGEIAEAEYPFENTEEGSGSSTCTVC